MDCDTSLLEIDNTIKICDLSEKYHVRKANNMSTVPKIRLFPLT